MTNRNGSYGSSNQNAPERHGKAGTGDNNKGTEYNSKRGSKSSLKNPQNHD